MGYTFHRGSRLRRVFGGVLGGLAVTSLLGAGTAFGATSRVAAHAKLTTVTFLLPGQVGGSNAFPYYGIKLGIFRKYGINLQISNPSSAAGATDVQYLEQGLYDVGYVSTPSLLVDRQQYNYDVVQFFGYLQNNPNCLVVPKALGITQVSQLIGKTISLSPTSNNASVLDQLAKGGVTASNSTIEYLSPNAGSAAYIAGKVQAINDFAFSQVPLFSSEGVPSTALCEDNEGLNFGWAGFAAKSSYIATHQRVMANLAAAMTQSLRETMKNPTLAAEALYSYFPALAPAPGVGGQEVGAEKPFLLTTNDTGHSYGWMSPKDWAVTERMCEAFFGLTSPFDLSAAWTDKFVH